MKKIPNILFGLLTTALLCFGIASAHAAETLIFGNDNTRPFSAKTLLINNQDRSGDMVLQFGDTLNKRLYWDTAAGQFIFTDNLEVQGTLSGSIIHATSGLSSSGSLDWDGSASGDSLWVSTFAGAGLTDCDAAGSKLIWDATTEKFSCGTDDDVPESGDFGAAGDLDADGTITDGVIDKADFSISTDFGDFSTDGSSNFLLDTGVVDADAIGADAVGTAELDDDANSPTAGDIVMVEAGDASFTYATPNAGTDVTADLEEETHASEHESGGDDAISHDSLTDFVSNEHIGWVVGDGATENFETTGSISGASLKIQGTMTGATAFYGAGLEDCEGSGNKITWDSATGKFQCETDETGADAIWTDIGDAIHPADNSGAEDVIIGSTAELTADIKLGSGGSAIFNDQSNNDVDFRIEGATNENLFFLDGSTDRIGIGTANPSTTLEVVGTASGQFLHAQEGLSSSGTLTIDGAATFGSTINVGSVTYTFPGSDGASSGQVLSTDSSGQLSWSSIGSGALKTRIREILIPIDSAAITTDGTDNELNVYVGSQTGATASPHPYYRAESGSGQLQDVDIRMQVLIPRDFLDFSNSNDLSFSYRNTGASDADSKLDILVEDADDDDAYTEADGQGLFNTSWTDYTDEFDGGSFNPIPGQYIFITIKSYASSSGQAYAGELVITYTSR